MFASTKIFVIVVLNEQNHLFNFIFVVVIIEMQIIFENQIIDRRFFVFKNLKRNHVEIKNFLSKHEKFHVFNRQMINKFKVFLITKQYLKNKTTN